MPINVLLNKHYIAFIAILFSFISYFYFGYDLERANFNALLLSYSLTFFMFLIIIKSDLNWKILLVLTVIFRLVFLVSTPGLSQDFYRFIWDGRLLFNGFNPYLYLPENYLTPNYTLPNQATELVNGMGGLNASHYSNYPPINQLCFVIAALFAKNSILGSIVVMRCLIILADIGTLYFGVKLLKALNLNPKAIFIYLLNPLIIIELTGNLHFEGVMIFFLVWSLYLFQHQQWKQSGIALAASIGVKLLPLLFLPLYFKHLSLKKLVAFFLIIGSCCLGFFSPFISENLIANYSKTIGLWFGTFEFNGSIYLLIREFGFVIKGYNIIGTIGKVTPLVVIIFVVALAVFWKKTNVKHLITVFLFALSVYLFTATTVHPWYLAMLLILSIFTEYRFPLIWTYTIIFSYSFYKNDTYINNYWLIALEYLLVFAVLIWEIHNGIKKKKSINN
ncbi:MAG: mannosyltransferase [Flavobacteriaceae bacterium]